MFEMNPTTREWQSEQWEDRAYAVVAQLGDTMKTERRGLSHVEAMMIAEILQADGNIVSVTHVVGANSYEVDRYPLR